MIKLRLKIQDFMARQSLFMMFLRSYILIVAILLLFSLFSYFVAIDRISDSVVQLNTVVLDGISTTLDKQFLEVEQMAYRLSSLGTTMKLAYMDVSSVDYYPEMTKYVKNLWSLWLENDALTPRMYVYFARSNVIASPATFYQFDQFYPNFFTYGNLDHDQFSSLLLESKNHTQYLPANSIWLNDDAVRRGTNEMVVYIYHLKSQSSADHPPGAIFFLIDTDEIRKMLDQLEIGEGGLAVVLDNEDRIVAKLDHDSGVRDEQVLQIAEGGLSDISGRMLVSSLSDHNGWTYLALGNQRVVMRPVVALRQIFIFLFLASLLGGLSMAFSMARKRSLPLFNLAHRLNPDLFPQYGLVKGYETLEQGVEQVLQTNMSMQERLREINPVLKSALMNQIFNGHFINDDEMLAASRRIDVELPPPPYCLVSFILLRVRDRMMQSREDFLRTVITQNAVEECLRFLVDGPLLLYKAGLDEAIWAYSLAGNDKEQELLDLLDKIVGWFDEHQTAIAIRYSRPFAELSNGWWEYAQLRQAYPNADSSSSKGSIEYAWNDPDPAKSQYMLLVEPILLSMYRTGDERMLARLMDIVQKEIFDDDEFDRDSRRILVRQFADLAAKLAGQPVKATGKSDDQVLDDYNRIRDIILTACNDSFCAKKESGSFLLRKILEFTDHQIFYAELSTKMIADAMHISENYLSRFFKEQYGDTLANYIEGRRITRSQELLLMTMLNISDIASQVGYHSDHVFRRAFRRVTHMSPNEYRQRNSSTP